MKRIELIFENEAGKNVTLSLDDPVEPVDAETVNEVMDEVITLNAFDSKEGDLVKKKAARMVERQVTNIDLDG